MPHDVAARIPAKSETTLADELRRAARESASRRPPPAALGPADDIRLAEILERMRLRIRVGVKAERRGAVAVWLDLPGALGWTEDEVAWLRGSGDTRAAFRDDFAELAALAGAGDVDVDRWFDNAVAMAAADLAEALSARRETWTGHDERHLLAARGKQRRAPGPGQAWRRCLRHGGRFLSDGPGNRLCAVCSGSAAWSTGQDYAAPAEVYSLGRGGGAARHAE